MAASTGSTLADALDAGPVLLDGGLSNQLEAQGCDLTDALWSARLLADAPEQIEAAHLAYLRAGARVLITASYQATFEGFGRYGLDRSGTEALLARSVELARGAADAARRAGPGRETWVAASVGPYGAMLADGSEYRGRYGLSVGELERFHRPRYSLPSASIAPYGVRERELERFHRPRVAALAAAGPDALALETVPDLDEAEALVRVAEETGLPYWLSYSVAGGRTRAGQPLEEAFAVAAGRTSVLAVGVNCCDPDEAQEAVELAVAVTGRPAVVYPNSGEGWD
ncbi:homocysteine S-methyltransferase family protein, partial [Streptomyces sp. MBT72]|uniref:homocysteine S-methyltransferase family protein n=1 Tax=Streptomyces sp. MBT72 TaxID=1488402 RepID=UPI0019161E7C